MVEMRHACRYCSLIGIPGRYHERGDEYRGE
jgi:hypothetical protein